MRTFICAPGGRRSEMSLGPKANGRCRPSAALRRVDLSVSVQRELPVAPTRSFALPARPEYTDGLGRARVFDRPRDRCDIADCTFLVRVLESSR